MRPLLLCLLLAGSAAARDVRPNVVLVYADDMGYGDLGVQNPDSKIPTPNLDRLAGEGMRFTDAHSSSGICTPSRYALLTGRHHWRKFHGIVQAFGPSVFDAERLTMAEMFRAAGYATACVGKWHLGWDWSAIRRGEAFDWSQPIGDGPLAHGFDHYFGDDVPNFPPYAWIEDDRVLEAPTVPYVPDPRPTEGNPEGRPGPMVAGWRQDAVMPRLTEHAVDWIAARAADEAPFFLYFPWTSPHAPIVPAEPWRGSTEAGGYGDFLHQSDAHLGAVLDALDEHGLAERTIVVFTADNGPEHYAYERVRRHEHRSVGPLRGLKRDLFEGGHRVPFLVRWPGVVEPGAVCDALVGQVDLMATFAAALDVALPDDAAEDSFDLTPLLRGAGGSGRTFHVHNTQPDRYAIRSEGWLLVDAPSGHHTRVPAWFAEAEGYATEAPGALYDLDADPGQRRDLCAAHPEKVAELRALLARVRAQGFSVRRHR